MPWERLKEIGKNYHEKKRGPGNKKLFTKYLMMHFDFSIERAANHPNCPSAKYLLEKLQKL